MVNPLRDIVRGDVPLAREIFGDTKKRRLIVRLQRDGWPIFDVAGKRCGHPVELRAYARRVQQQRHRRAAREITAA
jgi:hypothetical protein